MLHDLQTHYRVKKAKFASKVVVGRSLGKSRIRIGLGGQGYPSGRRIHAHYLKAHFGQHSGGRARSTTYIENSSTTGQT